MEKIAIIITIISVSFHGFFLLQLPSSKGWQGYDKCAITVFLDGLKWILMH